MKEDFENMHIYKKGKRRFHLFLLKNRIWLEIMVEEYDCNGFLKFEYVNKIKK